jgi:hypothetical protein
MESRSLVGIRMMLGGAIVQVLKINIIIQQKIDGEWYIFDDNGYAIQDCWYHDENSNV